MSDNQVTEPIETACFCKHGNLGQHESDCPKCPLHFTRGELNALQRERDQLRADLTKVREERDEAYLVQSRLRSQMEGKMECGHLRQYGTCGEVFPVHCLACANATLTAELEQASEDKERLDWLESKRAGVTTCHSGNPPWGSGLPFTFDGFIVVANSEDERQPIPTLRAAIDAARLAAKTEK